MTPQIIAEQLGKSGFCICENFLTADFLRGTQDDFDFIHASGKFKRAGTGQGTQREVRDIRRDEIYWFNREDSNALQLHLWEKLDLLKEAFNRNLFLGISEFEGHYAFYPVGGFYKKHLDSFQLSNHRVISFVLYLNRDWQSGDGGQLRIYKGNSYTDINPMGGTMLCFLSQESEHEVLLSHAARSSFVGWFKTH